MYDFLNEVSLTSKFLEGGAFEVRTCEQSVFLRPPLRTRGPFVRRGVRGLSSISPADDILAQV